MTPVSIFDQQALDETWRKLRLDPRSLRRLRIDFFKQALSLSECMLRMPDGTRKALSGVLHDQALTLDSRHDSRIDGATKLILRTRQRYLIESVLLRASTGRTTLCLSSQVGCAAACSFCATGMMGIAKDLQSDEIVHQLALANQLLLEEKRKVRNIVFMGMGEPLHNLKNVHAALRLLSDPSLFHHAPQKILLSTVGIAPALISTCKLFPLVNYAISLHSVRQSIRESIIPVARRHPLSDLRHAIQALNHIQSDRTSVMIEHLMLEGVNDSLEDAKQLAEWLEGLRIHLNLIPYNHVHGIEGLSGSPREQIESFAKTMKSSGVSTTIRYSMGSDIEAACGQLVRSENKSIGRQLLRS